MKLRVLDDLGPLYHSFALFGVENEQKPGHFQINQRCKEPIILAYIQFALAKSREKSNDNVSFAELFCADAYYAMAAKHFGATVSIGIDNNKDGHSGEFAQINQRLELGVRFIDLDVNRIDELDSVDVVANVGGLYHVANPVEILRKSHAMAGEFLIVQNVVSLATSSPTYFETPAPGWTWGSRFSRSSFEKLLKAEGFQIVDMHFNELEGNDRPEDRGSVYALIKTSTRASIRRPWWRIFSPAHPEIPR